MRAQSKVRERYVVVRMTHQQLLAVHGVLALSLVPTGCDLRAAKDGYEIVGHAAKAILQGERGNLTRAGMLYQDDGAYKEAQAAVVAAAPVPEGDETT